MYPPNSVVFDYLRRSHPWASFPALSGYFYRFNLLENYCAKQQTAKNLFLWPGRSFVRKGLEFPLALWIDLVLPKRRVLEIYLNIAEWGPSGQFGAESGAMYAFGHSASSLSPREAALMAAILPNPVKRSARNPGPGMRRLAGTYTARAQAAELQRCWRES